MVTISQKFTLGQIVATQGFLVALHKSGDEIWPYLRRHMVGDWGDLDQEDRATNDRALKTGERLLSVYKLSSGEKFYIITEASREVTTFLLPSEY